MGIDIIVKVLGVLKDWPILFPDQCAEEVSQAKIKGITSTL